MTFSAACSTSANINAIYSAIDVMECQWHLITEKVMLHPTSIVLT